MDNLSPYELAQQRIEHRQRRQTYTLAWLILAAISILLTFVAGNCVLPLAGIAVLFAVFSGIDWYFTSRKWTPTLVQVSQEMEWLFGEDWQNATGVYEYSLAMERIHQRRSAQKQFAFHLGFFLVANLFIFGLVVYNLRIFHTAGPSLVLIVPMVWLAVLAYHFIYAFPERRRLRQREQQAGEAIRRELNQMQPTKLKNEDKLKNDAFYTVGDDGELVEVDREVIEDSNPGNDNEGNIVTPEEEARSSNGNESVVDSLN
jgi:hypothetical protein